MESIADIQKREGFPVRVVNAKATTVTAYELLGGTAEGFYQTTITSAIPGKITTLNVSVGDTVEQNFSLMTIEPDLPANYNLAKTQFENSRKSRERVLALAEQGGISQEVIDQVDAGFLAAKEGMEAMHKNQFVPAPFSGTVVELFQTDNQRVSPGDNLVTVARINRIRIPLVVSDILINKFKTGQKALALNGNDSIYGTINKVALSGQQSTHTFIIEAVFDNSEKILKPGMYIPVKVIIDRKNQVVSLPIEAVISQGVEKFVFVVKDLMAKKVPVKLGIRDENLLEIVSGIAEGDLVVVSGMSMLADGARVKIVEE
ncbi:MAG TPA: efflux RND transporter periplasmic adaptor subunit [Chitinispirillaceae bacterium]|nr:efflux RND transporter periplasmic adaptor subunit [Chitinispirillaceae bacterium]